MKKIEKLPYEKPELVDYGRVAEQTATNTGSGADGGSTLYSLS